MTLDSFNNPVLLAKLGTATKELNNMCQLPERVFYEKSFDLQRFGQYLVRAGLAFLIAYLLFSILGPYLVAWGVEADKSGMLIGSIMQYLGTQFQAFTNPIIGILLLTIGPE